MTAEWRRFGTWGTFVRLEAALLLRSLRGRVALSLFLVATVAPAVLAARAQHGIFHLGAGTYAADVMSLLPAASALLAAVLGLDAVVRERRSGCWSVLQLGPLSSAGYLTRRLVAQLVLLLPLSAAPLLLAALLAAADGAPAAPLVNWLLPWLVRVAPAVVGTSAAAIAAGTLADGWVPGAVLLAALAMLLPSAVNGVLGPLRRHAQLDPGAWLGIPEARDRIAHYVYSLPAYRLEGLRAVIPASEAPLPVAAYVTQALSRGLLPFACCLALFGGSVAYLRRTTRDLPPVAPRPGHPLATLLGLAAGLRSRALPDTRLERADRALLALAGLLLASAGASWALRDRHYQAVVRETHELLASGWPSSVSAAVVPLAARLEARLLGGGRVTAESELTLRNTGETPVASLAFTLDPGQELAGVTVDRGTVQIERRRDRIAMTLAPPLAAGAVLRLGARTVGRPERLRLALPGGDDTPFERRYRLHTRALAADLLDLAASLAVPAAGDERVELDWNDVAPLPRTVPFALTRTEALAGGALEVEPPERSAAEAALEIAVTAPAATRLADACGGTGDAQGELRPRCTLALRSWKVAGGALREVSGAGVYFAVLPQHAALAAAAGEELTTLPALVRQAWPGAETAPPPVLLEDPPAWSDDPRRGVADWSVYNPTPDRPRSAGRLLLVPERWLVRDRRLPLDELVASSVANGLLARRAIAAADAPVVDALLRAMVLARLGRKPPSGATIACRRMDLEYYRLSLFDPDVQTWNAWRTRVEALALELANRAGGGAVQRGSERFFAAATTAPGTLAELVRSIGDEARVDLEPLTRDFFAGSALPELALADVRATHGPTGYAVSGRVLNQGTGTARCPVAVTTSTGTVEAVVEVGAGAARAFEVNTTGVPQAVLLDPDATCFRWRSDPPGLLRDRWDLEGGGS